MKKFVKSFFALLFVFFIFSPSLFAFNRARFVDNARTQANIFTNRAGSLYGNKSIGARYWKEVMGEDKRVLGYSDNWCAVFVNWCARESGYRIPVRIIPWRGSDSRCGAGDLADYFVAIRKWKGPNVTPREGDIVFFNDPCYGRYARGTNI